MNNSYTIKDLIQLFLSKIWLIIIVTVVGAAAGFGVSKLCIDKKYSSYITLYVQCYTDIKDDNNQSDISKSKQLIGTYIELLGQDDYVMNQISDDLVKKFDEATLKYCFSMNENGIKPSSLRASLSLTSVTDTSAINAVATTKNAKVSAAILESLKNHANDIVTEAVGVGSINAVSEPEVIPEKVSPNEVKNAFLGGAAGFMLIILIILIIDFFDDTIKETSGIENKFKASILGQVEKVVLLDENGKKIKEKKKIKPVETLKRKFNKNNDKSSVEDKHYKLTDDNIPFYFKESFKSIRTNVTFSLAASDKKNIFAVTSANPSEGKSTISSNLAIAFAESGKNVLLIDADMRRHVQDRIFKVYGKVGLSTAIVDVAENPEILETIKPYESKATGEDSVANESTVAKGSQEKTDITDSAEELEKNFMKRYIQEISLKTKTKVENDEGKQVEEETEVKLHVMPAGKVPPNPSELLASEQMQKMLDKLSTVFETIIIDTAPINSVSDSMQFADRISGIVIVARCNQTTEDSIEAAMKQVELSKMHLLGFVLNDVNTGHHGKYYKRYYRGGDYDKYSY